MYDLIIIGIGLHGLGKLIRWELPEHLELRLGFRCEGLVRSSLIRGHLAPLLSSLLADLLHLEGLAVRFLRQDVRSIKIKKRESEQSKSAKSPR